MTLKLFKAAAAAHGDAIAWRACRRGGMAYSRKSSMRSFLAFMATATLRAGVFAMRRRNIITISRLALLAFVTGVTRGGALVCGVAEKQAHHTGMAWRRRYGVTAWRAAPWRRRMVNGKKWRRQAQAAAIKNAAAGGAGAAYRRMWRRRRKIGHRQRTRNARWRLQRKHNGMAASKISA